MKVDLREKVSKFQEKFKSEFGIRIRVYKGAKFAPDAAMGMGFAKVNIPLIGKRRKKRVTYKGSGLFSRFF